MSALFAAFADSSASVSFAAGMPLSRMNFASGTSPDWIALVSASSFPGAPFWISSLAISVCSGFFFCAGPVARASGVKP